MNNNFFKFYDEITKKKPKIDNSIIIIITLFIVVIFILSLLSLSYNFKGMMLIYKIFLIFLSVSMGLFILFIGYLFFTQYYSNAQKPPDISSNPTSDNETPSKKSFAEEFMKETRVKVPESAESGIEASSIGSSILPGNESSGKQSQSSEISLQGPAIGTSSLSQSTEHNV